MEEAYTSEELATLELATIVSSMVLLELATVMMISSCPMAIWVVSTLMMAAMAQVMHAIGSCCCTAGNVQSTMACMYTHTYLHAQPQVGIKQ